MSEIKKIVKDKGSVLVFDVDGVLAVMEFGEHNHYTSDDEERYRANISWKNFYTKEKVSKKMQNFLSKKDIGRVYVITKAASEQEFNHKKSFLRENYNIRDENIYWVKKEVEKKEKLLEIKWFYEDLPDYKLVMIDDSVTILCDVMDNTGFSTMHISSFLDM